MAVKKDGEALKYVKYNLLPEKNRDKIYAKLCKIAVRYSSLVLEFVNFSLINKKFYLDIYKSAIKVLLSHYMKLNINAYRKKIVQKFMPIYVSLQ